MSMGWSKSGGFARHQHFDIVEQDLASKRRRDFRATGKAHVKCGRFNNFRNACANSVEAYFQLWRLAQQNVENAGAASPHGPNNRQRQKWTSLPCGGSNCAEPFTGFDLRASAALKRTGRGANARSVGSMRLPDFTSSGSPIWLRNGQCIADGRLSGASVQPLRNATLRQQSIENWQWVQFYAHVAIMRQLLSLSYQNGLFRLSTMTISHLALRNVASPDMTHQPRQGEDMNRSHAPVLHTFRRSNFGAEETKILMFCGSSGRDDSCNQLSAPFPHSVARSEFGGDISPPLAPDRDRCAIVIDTERLSRQPLPPHFASLARRFHWSSWRQIRTPSDEVLGLELGADWIIAKPFHPRVLVARLNALTRRAAVRDRPASRTTLSFGRLNIDGINREVQYDNVPVGSNRQRIRTCCGCWPGTQAKCLRAMRRCASCAASQDTAGNRSDRCSALRAGALPAFPARRKGSRPCGPTATCFPTCRGRHRAFDGGWLRRPPLNVARLIGVGALHHLAKLFYSWDSRGKALLVTPDPRRFPDAKWN